MSREPLRPLISGLLAAAAVFAPSLSPSVTQADLIRLNSGGEIRGIVERDVAAVSGSTVTIRTLTGGTITVNRDDIEFVTPRSLEVEQYETRAREVSHTVAARWELAEWCRENRLKRQRDEQLELILELDPDHAAAHKSLGHVRHDGEWMTRDELMATRGYIKHKGRYVTQQELDLLNKTAAERANERKWFGKVRLWYAWATGNHDERRREGMANLQTISDPDAVRALETVFADLESAKARLLYVQILGNLSGNKPVKPLVDRSLYDGSSEVRLAALMAVGPEQHSVAVRYLIPALREDSNAVVRRAATGLGQFAGPEAVPYLANALVTTHRYKVRVPAPRTSFSGVSSGRPISGGSPGAALPPEVEAMLRTGQLQHGVHMLPTQADRLNTRVVTVKAEVRNPEVLAALQRISGKDFGYNERSWKLWWAAVESGEASFES